jgi:N-acetylneuraminate synthase
MPKKGYDSVTIPAALNKRIETYLDTTEGILNNKTQAIMHAWQLYENFMLKEKNPAPVKIGNRLIGHEQPVFIVAEIGINHNGDMEICKKLIDLAVSTGCDAVKFQKRTPELCVPEAQKSVPKETPWGTMTYLEYKKKMEFGKKEYEEIDEYCKKKGIMWYASAWDTKSVDFLEKFDMPCYKVPSACLTDKELLLKLKETKKPIILSTGMSTMDQVKEAVSLIGEENLILLHCNSSYPATDEELNLNAIKTFKKQFNCPIGYSGHETGVYSSIAAAVIGSCMIERHITLDRAMFGTDQAASLEVRGLSIIANEIKSLQKIMGDGQKKVYDSEKPIMKKLRKHHS